MPVTSTLHGTKIGGSPGLNSHQSSSRLCEGSWESPSGCCMGGIGTHMHTCVSMHHTYTHTHMHKGGVVTHTRTLACAYTIYTFTHIYRREAQVHTHTYTLVCSCTIHMLTQLYTRTTSLYLLRDILEEMNVKRALFFDLILIMYITQNFNQYLKAHRHLFPVIQLLLLLMNLAFQSEKSAQLFATLQFHGFKIWTVKMYLFLHDGFLTSTYND